LYRSVSGADCFLHAAGSTTNKEKQNKENKMEGSMYVTNPPDRLRIDR